MDLSLSGKVGVRALLYYLVTTVLAVILGILLVESIKPGKNKSGDQPHIGHEETNVTTPDTLMDLVRNCFPPNLVQATMQQYGTHLIDPIVNVRFKKCSVKHLICCCRKRTQLLVPSSIRARRTPGILSHPGIRTPPTL